MEYRDFVKKHIKDFDTSVKYTERIKQIAKMWQAQKSPNEAVKTKAKTPKSKKEKGGDLFGDMFPVLGMMGAGLKKKTKPKKEKGGDLQSYAEDENIDILNQLKNINLDGGGGLKKKQKIRKTKAGAFNYNIVPNSTSQMAQSMYPGPEGLAQQLQFEQLAVDGPNLDGGKLKKTKLKKLKGGAFDWSLVSKYDQDFATAQYPNISQLPQRLALEKEVVGGKLKKPKGGAFDVSSIDAAAYAKFPNPSQFSQRIAYAKSMYPKDYLENFGPTLGGKLKNIKNIKNKKGKKGAPFKAKITDFIIKAKKKSSIIVSRSNQQALINKGSIYKGGALNPEIPNQPMGPVVQANNSNQASSLQSWETLSPSGAIVYDWATMPAAWWAMLSVDDIQKITPANLQQMVGNQLDFNSMPFVYQQQITNNMGPAQEAAMLQAIDNLAWWLAPTDPMWQTTLSGVPYFWLCHPNQYAGGTSQIMLYGSYQDFQNTTFYSSFSSRFKTVAAPMNFERYLGGEQPNSRADEGNANSSGYLYNIIKQYGQKFRVMLMKGDLSGIENTGNNWNVVYIDATDLQDYLNMMNAFYNDRDTIQPAETIQMLHTAYLAAQAKLQAQYIAQGIGEGQAQQKAADDAADQIKAEQEQLIQQQEQADEQKFEQEQQGNDASGESPEAQEQSGGDGSDIWGTIGHIAEIGAMFL